VIEAATRGAKWWVGYDGVTNVGERAGTPAAPGTYEVLNFNPRTAEAVLALDEINAVLPGMMISERLDAPLIVRSLEITIEAPGSLRAIAWCGTGRAEQGADLMREIVNRIVSPQRFGKRRYRVVNMAGDRVDLQIVRKASGWPDLASVAMWAGVAGVHADLTPGAEVLVELVEGDEAQPVIVGFVGRGGQGHVAEHVTIGAADSDDAMPAARQGDTVRVLLPPMVFTGTIGGSPATGVLSAMTGSTLGTIETGSPKVGIGPGP
jgi:hypothetical protein